MVFRDGGKNLFLEAERMAICLDFGFIGGFDLYCI